MWHTTWLQDSFQDMMVHLIFRWLVKTTRIKDYAFFKQNTDNLTEGEATSIVIPYHFSINLYTVTYYKSYY